MLGLALAASLPLVASRPTTASAAQPPSIRFTRGSEAAVGKAAATRPYTVAVLGDGFGEALAEGLKLNFVNQPAVAILQKTHAPFGLSQDAMFEWTIAAQNMFAGPDHVDAAVIMLGANDMVPLKENRTTIDPQAPRWKQLYGDRVETLAALFRAKNIPLTWVGLPIVQDAALSAEFVVLNEIIRDRAVKAGASYVDSWEAFVDEGGKYDQVGPDLNGRIAKLRTADGIDFTQAGARKLASFVETNIRQGRDKAKPAPVDPSGITIPTQPDFDNALQVDISAQIRREAGVAAPPSSHPDDAPGRTPQIGPVITITAPALATDGHLAEKNASMLAGLDGTLTRRALVEGLPIQPKPGRTDDFSWPRP